MTDSARTRFQAAVAAVLWRYVTDIGAGRYTMKMHVEDVAKEIADALSALLVPAAPLEEHDDQGRDLSPRGSLGTTKTPPDSGSDVRVDAGDRASRGRAEVSLPAAPPAFPIMEDPQVHSIPWAVIAPHEAQAHANHDQSLQHLAKRGGLSCCEAVAVLEDRPWHRMDDNIARSCLIQLVTNHGAAHRPPETGWYPCACGAEHDSPECPFGYTNKLRP